MLQKRSSGVWYFRPMVPKALRPAVGKLEVVRSLRTRSAPEARRRAAAIAARTSRAFDRARRRLPLTRRGAQWLARRWLKKGLVADAHRRAVMGAGRRPVVVDGALVDSSLPELEADLARGATSRADPVAHSLLPDSGYVASEDSQAFRQFTADVLKAMVDYFRALDDRNRGSWR